MGTERTELAPGTPVRVRADTPSGHCRTPRYLRGHTGVVEQLLGTYRNPEQLAVHKPGLPKCWLYRVRFRQTQIWPDYEGPSGDELVADLYEHWLDPLEEVTAP